MSSSSKRPIYDSMTKKVPKLQLKTTILLNLQITEALNPTILEIVDDSTLHAEHEAMRENGYNETHFKVLVVSELFKPKVSENSCVCGSKNLIYLIFFYFSLIYFSVFLCLFPLLIRCPFKDIEWFTLY